MALLSPLLAPCLAVGLCFLRWMTGAWDCPHQSSVDPSRPVLAQVHTVLLVDDSESMVQYGTANSLFESRCRWYQAPTLTSNVAPIIAWSDAQGMDIHFLSNIHRFGSHMFHQGLQTSRQVQNIFSRVEPAGDAPLGKQVYTVLDAYLAVLRYNRPSTW